MIKFQIVGGMCCFSSFAALQKRANSATDLGHVRGDGSDGGVNIATFIGFQQLSVVAAQVLVIVGTRQHRAVAVDVVPEGIDHVQEQWARRC